MTAETNAAALAADFNRYFTSSNEVAPNARISVPTAEWQALYAALLRAGATKVPDVLVDQAWYWVRYEGLSGVLEAPAMYKADAEAFYSVAFSGIPTREIEVIRELTATPPAPDAGVVGCGSAVCPHGAECVHAQKGTQ